MNERSLSTDTNGPARPIAVDLVEKGVIAAALLAADEAGLWAALQRGGVRAPTSTTTAQGRAERLVLDLLGAAGLVAWSEGTAGLSASARELEAGIPGGLSMMMRMWRQLPALLQRGEPLARMDGTAREREAAYAGVVPALGTMFGAAADALAERLPTRVRVLDVGAGSGVWSLAMIRGIAEAHATAFDLPDVLPAFRARADALGLSQRAHTLAGDYHRDADADALHASFDRVVLANVLHLEEERAAAALVARWARALGPAGDLVVVDSFADGARPGDAVAARAHAAYALLLAVRTTGAQTYARERVEQWLRDAGLVDVTFIHVGGPLESLGAIVARRAP